MYAIIQTGGKQYKVQVNDIISIERIQRLRLSSMVRGKKCNWLFTKK